MMKKTLSIVSLLMAVLMLALCCTACGGDNKEESATVPDATQQSIAIPTEQGAALSLAGTYQCVDMVVSGADRDQIEQMLSSFSLVIREDNTATLTNPTQSVECVFDTDSMTASPTSTTGSPIAFTFDGTKLTMGDSDQMLIFQKIN